MNKKITFKKSITFALCTIIGLLLVVVPFSFTTENNVKVDTITFYYLKQLVALGGFYLSILLTIAVSISAILCSIDYLLKPNFIRNNQIMTNLFSCNLLDTIFRILGALISIMVLTKLGPNFITEIDTGGTMLDLSTTLSIIIPPMLFLQTFILEFGFMEFLGTLIGFIVRPIFKVSSMASVSIMSAWLGPGNAAILASKQLFDEGYYTFKEAATIGTMFATSSIGWCVLVANVLGIMDYFGIFYLTITAIGIIVAFIGVRIPPISKYEDIYSNGEKREEKEEKFEESIFEKALERACERVEKVSYKNFTSKFKNMLGYIFALQPIIICWGTIALIISKYTNVLIWLSYPIAWIIKLFGITGANEAAPAILSGFADNYLPVILGKGIDNIQIKFIIGTMSILQLIFMSEIGALLASTKLTKGFKDILIIFIERTLISLPLVLIIAKLIF